MTRLLSFANTATSMITLDIKKNDHTICLHIHNALHAGECTKFNVSIYQNQEEMEITQYATAFWEKSLY
ncbi:hypothetical protein M404DRAFT_32931 [Pisolithus tinctorius Marx 270]|uniref:Uncharacterized protein n=1 Tax=Pisolithus tinctorius Marx 270 TaxID=870435 RepID=A0A0C3IIG2_PISTI|nr:hypothetical protein M404DRAFT_32931 [Pisolithus tinctorius Marx 270]